jgi:Tfp pilus assembly protein PilF
MTLRTLLALLFMAQPKPPAPMPPAEVQRARSLERQASELQRSGRYLDAEKPLLEAIALWTQYRGADDIEVLNDTMNLAVAYRRHGDAARAVPLLERASQGLAACKDADAPELRRRAMNNLAMAYQYADRRAEARKTWESLLEQLGSAPSEERARVLDNLASLLREMGDLSHAEAYARRGYEDWRKLRGDEDVDTAVSLSVLGALESSTGRYKEARSHLEESLRITEKLRGPEHPEVAGVLEVKTGHPQAARADYERSLAISRPRLDAGHSQITDALEGLRALDAGRDAGR